MATVKNAVNVDIKDEVTLHQWVISVADMLRVLSDDLQLVEAQLNGRLRAIPSVDGKNSNGKARNVVSHVKQARLFVWAARKSTLGVYKAFQRQFGPELAAAKKPKKTEEFKLNA